MATGGGGHDLSRSQLNAGDELFDHHCTPCQKRNKNRAASKYCGICLEYMCTECVNNHNSFKPLSKHVLVDISQVQVTSGKERSGHLLSVPTEMCRNHPMKVVDMYCENDDCVGCSVCIAPHYSSCANIHYIPEYVKSIAFDAQNNQTIADLSACLNNISALKKRQNNLTKNLAKDKDACKKRIRSFRMEIKKVVDNLEQTSLNELDKEYRKLDEEIENEIKRIEEIEKELVRLKRKLEVSHENESQQFAVTKMSLEIITDSVKLASEMKMFENTTLHFDENTAILMQLQQFESLQMSLLQTPIVAFPASQSPAEFTSTALRSSERLMSPTFNRTANLKCIALQTSCQGDKGLRQMRTKVTTKRETKTKLHITETEKLEDTTAQTTSDISRLYMVKSKSKYSVKISSDQTASCIRSVCILDNGDLLLSDTKNQAIKLFDMNTYEVTDFLKVSSEPNRICRVNRNTVALSRCGNIIQFIATGDKLLTIRQIATECRCYALVVVENNLYVCDDDNSVHVFTLIGELVKTMRFRSSSPSNLNLIYNDIALNDEGTVVFTCDPEGLSAINLAGNVVWQHNNKDETHARGLTGVCGDGRRHLFVSGFVSGNVVVLNQSGMYIREIISRGVDFKRAAAIAFHKEKQELIVATDENDVIFVFSFQ